MFSLSSTILQNVQGLFDYFKPSFFSFYSERISEKFRGSTNIKEQKILFITIVPDIAGSQNEKFKKDMEMRIALIQ